MQENQGSKQPPPNTEEEPETPIKLDEVKTFLDCRWVTPHEAFWRLAKFPIHYSSHTVHRLPIHLPNRQRVHFVVGNLQNVLQRQGQQLTQLTAYFRLNSVDEQARTYLYSEIPEHYVWDKQNTQWKRRRQNPDESKTLARIYYVPPKRKEIFCLRLLLLHVKGATSFEDLRTVDQTTCDTFEEACRMKGLLQSEEEWHHVIEETTITHMPRQIRALFALICHEVHPTSARNLWNTFSVYMTEDFVHRGMDEPTATKCALFEIRQHLQDLGGVATLQSLELPPLDSNFIPPIDFQTQQNQQVQQQQHEQQQRNLRIEENEPRLNREQKVFYDAVVERFSFIRVHPDHNNVNNSIMFLDAPGGTGKTFVVKAIMDKM